MSARVAWLVVALLAPPLVAVIAGVGLVAACAAAWDRATGRGRGEG
jgi:hypothetical protein